jgi:uncharacterized membrane protein (DUF485 family)
MSELLEACMVIFFGFSWPMALIKSYKGRTARGKSLWFLLFVLSGYACGIAAKLLSGNMTYVFIFYVLNFIMVFTDVLLYFRNSLLDRRAKSNGEQET